MYHTLFILDYFHPFIGGSETLFDDVTKFCSEKNMKITVLTARHDPKLQKIEKKGKVTIYRIGNKRRTMFFSVLRFSLRNRELICSLDHIHTSTFVSSIGAWIIGKIWNKPVTITIHEIYDQLWYHLKGKWGLFYIGYEQLICTLPWNQIITVSQASKDKIQSRYPRLTDNKLSVIKNQIDTKFWNPDIVKDEEKNTLRKQYNIPESDNLIIFIGRLGYEKGLPYLIEAFSQLHKDNTNTKLIIIAPRTISKHNKKTKKQINTILHQIKDNYLSSSIIWRDPVTNNETLRTWISISDIGAVPSMSEGFCYIAVQMQAMGLQIISSKVGALPEVLAPENTRFVEYGKVQQRYEALKQSTSSHKEKSSQNNNPKIIDYTAYYNLLTKE